MIAIRTVPLPVTTLVFLTNGKGAKNGCDAINAFFANCDPSRKDHDTGGYLFRDWKNQTGVRIVRSIRLHVVASRPEVLPRQHVLGMQNVHNAVARHREVRRDVKDDVLVVIALRFIVL